MPGLFNGGTLAENTTPRSALKFKVFRMWLTVTRFFSTLKHMLSLMPRSKCNRTILLARLTIPTTINAMQNSGWPMARPQKTAPLSGRAQRSGKP